MATRIISLKDALIRYLPYILILAGLGLALLAVAVDFLGLGGSSGFGSRQIKIAALGLVFILFGTLTVPLIKLKFLLRWLMPSVQYQQPEKSALRRLAGILLLAVWFGLLIGFSDL